MESFTNFIAESFDPKNTYKIISTEFDPNEDEFLMGRDVVGKNFNDSPQQRRVTFKFKSDNGTYFDISYSTKYNAEKWDWHLVFSNNRKDDGWYLVNKDIMGGFKTNEVIKILNTVMKTIKDMLSRIRVDDGSLSHMDSINFQAKVSEPSRVKLYKRMFNKFASKLDNFKVRNSVDEKPDGEGFINFQIRRTTMKEKDEVLQKEKEEKEKKDKKEKGSK